ncbi:hypothetical protein PG999_014275 [Apiospora kogelbergensis]|uniref:Uncharacterized protein n=1 Tax=Apiospora kogelbergensis TaxID=1337665 RepID=A0AAW0Q8S2_9PEZI
MAPSETQPIGFLFINTAHPSEASTSKSLSRIRSHAAKEMRARAAKIHERTKYRARRSQQAISDPTGTSRRRAQRGEDGEKRSTALLPQRVLAQPLAVKEPHWNLVRTLSAHETSLLDHYIHHVILTNKGRCLETGIDAQPWFTSMQLKCWLPFALADPGLLATLLLQSCRSLESTGDSGSYYTATYANYKQQCIQWVNHCLSSEDRRTSDATVAMVMVLLTESYVLGNREEWKVHLDAHTRMLELRGGVDALGLDGFLRSVIEK